MATLEENKRIWDGKYEWPEGGDEWSAAWGGARMQWYGTLLPRIHAFVPVGSMLEIACGYGRWTQFLKDLCTDMTVVDLSESCISACRKRFANETHIKYVVNNGKSLDMVPDESQDFVFSFDSLVHAEAPVLKNYITQLRRILKPTGVAFIHHSNLGEYPIYSQITPFSKKHKLLAKLGVMEENTHWRANGVTGQAVADHAATQGLRCISQEMVNWGTKKALIDCFSTIVRDDSPLCRETEVVRNPNAMAEAETLLKLSKLYEPPAK